MLCDKRIFLVEDDLKINFEGKSIKFNTSIYKNINRYFMPILEFVNQTGGKININGSKIDIKFKEKSSICIDYCISDYKFTVINSAFYISLFDMCRILSIRSKWDYSRSTISLYWDKINYRNRKNIYGRVGLIRFEDITAGGEYLDSDNLEKLRVVADYMYSAGIPFHIAWIPRFVDPQNGIDNDISKDYSMPNANFLFTMEYLLNRNGTIGLHGYTHQYGDEVSAVGTEFSDERNNDEKSIRKRVEAAINTAKKLELPVKFFETPHYAATAFQQSIFEQYFDIIYEPFVGIWGDRIVKSPRNYRTLYIPTPLGYVEEKDGIDKMINRINNLGEATLASLFYHPYIDFEYITLKIGISRYKLSGYSENSPLHEIAKALYYKGGNFTKITDLNLNSKKYEFKKLFYSFLNSHKYSKLR
ncbi:polysaccharide deacetylase family protein [Clostridium sp. YIM B02500]|uniref:polysaccharide deacetylase family protein n=1 Tax=Clostridium sp. YIM B02500 TaxID=2910681 RepID=UPI001EEE7DE6|nr:polysaccharide deacetylase family protein [Clostridium sp. YIM B02500]